jgi:hypothetical protein
MTFFFGRQSSQLKDWRRLKSCVNECLGAPMILDRDFSEFVELFRAHNVRFLVVGGYAMAVHGLPRATGDFDAWIWIDEVNAAKVLAALNDFGFGSMGLSAEDFLQPNSIIQLGYPPYRVDILTSIEGVEFDFAWSRRIELQLENGVLPVIGREDLVTNKRAAGRPQDIADVARLLDSGSE